jgi:cytochrome c-type biogenesis protein CcmH/NrfG
MTIMLRGSVAALALLIASPAMAGTYQDLRETWATIQYQTPEDQKQDAMSKLKEEADAAAQANPASAETLIWDGIITSSLAGIKGGLGALSLAKEARDKLQEAEKLDPNALNGSAKTSLGALYYQVPGWPIGFGSDKKAKNYLTEALAIDPNGIDPNYFYADFLFSKGDYNEARTAAEKALKATPRPGREVADAGRRGETQALLAKISEKLDK